MTMMFIEIFIKIVITIYLYSTVSQLAHCARKCSGSSLGCLHTPRQMNFDNLAFFISLAACTVQLRFAT